MKSVFGVLLGTLSRLLCYQTVSLQRAGYDEALAATETILTALRANGGALPLSDKSEPDDIYRRLGIKKVFKKALGTL